MVLVTKSFSELLKNAFKAIPLDEEGNPVKVQKAKPILEFDCYFCGYEKCMKSRHTKGHIRDLLVDAGIIEDTDAAFSNWLHTSKSKQYPDPENYLMGYDPSVVWGVYPWKVAKYVRSIV